jgi:hypothetical protein
VSRLADEWTGGRIVRVNLTAGGASKEYADRLGVVETPTFVLFDGSGREQRRWVSRVPDRDALP